MRRERVGVALTYMEGGEGEGGREEGRGGGGKGESH